MKDIYIPEITKEAEYFDPSNFSSEPQNIKLETISDIGTKYISKRVKTYYETDFEGNTIVSYYKNNKGEIEGHVFPYHSIIGIVKIFYRSGHLKTKGLVYYSGFNIGTWYEFNENGEFIGTVDKDKEYPFGWKDVFIFCEKNEISLERIGNGKATTIIKNKLPDGKYCWDISFVNKYTKGESTRIVIDGGNGKVLSKEEEEWSPHIRLDDEE